MSTMTVPVNRAAQVMRPAPRTTRATSEPVRLTRRGRVVLGLVIFLVAAGLFVALGGASMATSDEVPNRTTRVLMIHSGDTLWDIAYGLTAGQGTDAMVRNLMEMNGLESGLILPGQKLRVPVV